MTRDLADVTELPRAEPRTATGTALFDGAPGALTSREEQQFRAALFTLVGDALAEKGWARIPAWSDEERARLAAVGRALGEHWGQAVTAEPEDECSMFFALDVTAGPVRPDGVPGAPRA
ncbi:hypothetical protein [Streptomyces zingiberis]|uniref:hypothetical protein n=1 Tax=Streptomyces zingiberis TaxID=2053010 RepID=UPI0019D0967D|nr:hypothetical protein [Streptomyces zingiberis]